MIVTPLIPTLVEESINIGTECEFETPEETAKEFVANSSTNKKAAFMKQAGVTLIYVAISIEKESDAYEEMKKLAEEKVGKIKSLESQLKEETMINTQLHQSLNKANEELQWLRKDKEMNDHSCSEAFKKVEEF